jgi:hypothetical protein
LSYFQIFVFFFFFSFFFENIFGFLPSRFLISKKMKIKALRLSSSATSSKRRAVAGAVPRVERSLDPALHPHEREREVVRATNAAKVARLVSRPFQGALTGHADGVCAMSRHATRLNVMFTGACDGEVSGGGGGVEVICTVLQKLL